MFDHTQDQLLREIRDILRDIRDVLKSIPKAAKIYQIIGDKPMAITGTNVGGNSAFEMDPVGAAAWPAGTQFTWTEDDPAVTLGPDSGPNGNQVSASDAATDTATSYNVPLIPTPPPVPTSGIINQIS